MPTKAPKVPTSRTPTATPEASAAPEHPEIPAALHLSEEEEGLWIVGTVTSRKRRQVTIKGNKTRWIVTLTILAANEVHRLDRWCDAPSPAECPNVGDPVKLLLRQRVFSANGVTRVSLEWGPASTEDDF